MTKSSVAKIRETQAVKDARSRAILILKSLDSFDIIAVLAKTTDAKVFEYAIKNLGVRANRYVWHQILKLAPEKLLFSAIEKYHRESGGGKAIFEVIYNPNISDSDFDYVISLATETNSLDYIFGRLPDTISVRVAAKLAALARSSDIDNVPGYPGLVALRIFGIHAILQKDITNHTWRKYVSDFAHDDIDIWVKKCRPSKEDFLMVIVTFFCCAQEMNIKCGVPNIEVLVLR